MALGGSGLVSGGTSREGRAADDVLPGSLTAGDGGGSTAKPARAVWGIRARAPIGCWTRLGIASGLEGPVDEAVDNLCMLRLARSV